MNTRSRKALSPVVASIILIAVTVAVSIAVAAWMGALSFNFMNTEQGQLTNLQYTTDNVAATFQNTGTTPITITEYWVNGAKLSAADYTQTVSANSQYTFNIGITLTLGNQYEVKLVSSKGNAFLRTGVA